MSKKSIQDLTREQKGDLIVELVSFAITRNRIWRYNTPSVELARLIRDIVQGFNQGTLEGGYLDAELKKAPKELQEKLAPYV